MEDNSTAKFLPYLVNSATSFHVTLGACVCVCMCARVCARVCAQVHTNALARLTKQQARQAGHCDDVL